MHILPMTNVWSTVNDPFHLKYFYKRQQFQNGGMAALCHIHVTNQNDDTYLSGANSNS